MTSDTESATRQAKDYGINPGIITLTRTLTEDQSKHGQAGDFT
jgi:hypothetical protein